MAPNMPALLGAWPEIRNGATTRGPFQPMPATGVRLDFTRNWLEGIDSANGPTGASLLPRIQQGYDLRPRIKAILIEADDEAVVLPTPGYSALPVLPAAPLLIPIANVDTLDILGVTGLSFNLRILLSESEPGLAIARTIPHLQRRGGLNMAKTNGAGVADTFAALTMIPVSGGDAGNVAWSLGYVRVRGYNRGIVTVRNYHATNAVNLNMQGVLATTEINPLNGVGDGIGGNTVWYNHAATGASLTIPAASKVLLTVTDLPQWLRFRGRVDAAVAAAADAGQIEVHLQATQG